MSYPRVTYPAGLATGYELSPAPVQGGSLLTISEASVVAPSDPVTIGQACVIGSIVGVCVTAPAAANADCVIQTTGIFSQPVVASDDEGTAAVAVGAALYIDSATAVISLDATSGPLYGFALSALSGSASPSNICVKLATI